MNWEDHDFVMEDVKIICSRCFVRQPKGWKSNYCHAAGCGAVLPKDRPLPTAPPIQSLFGKVGRTVPIRRIV